MPVAVVGSVTITGTVSISGTVTISGSVEVTNVVSVTGTVAISGTVTVTGTVAISGTVTVAGAVTVSGTVSISGTVTVSGTVSISGTVTVTGSVTVSGTVSISGTVTITGTVSISGTVTISGDVTITSGAVTISTSGGTNIIIDKLTQGSWTPPRHVEFAADNGVESPDAPPSNRTAATYYGKWIPWGTHGNLQQFKIYCKRTGAGTITLAYAPKPGMGKVGSVTITPGADWDWKYTAENKFWPYSSIFIWVESCSADVSYGYDTAAMDEFQSTDSGVTWFLTGNRLFIRVQIYGLTVGDLPVSGTVNTIGIPASSSTALGDGVTVPSQTETLVVEQYGAGMCDHLWAYVLAETGSHSVQIRVYCDGNLAYKDSFSTLNTRGHTASTPKESLLTYAANGLCVMALSKIFEFKRHLAVKAYHAEIADMTVYAKIHPNLIS